MQSKLCYLNRANLKLDSIKELLLKVDGQVEEFIVYQSRMLSSALEKYTFSDEQKKCLEFLLLEEYIKDNKLPF